MAGIASCYGGRAEYRADTKWMTRRLPAPWTAERMPGGYVVRDANGQALAYVYSRAIEADAMQAKVLTEDEARRGAIKGARNSRVNAQEVSARLLSSTTQNTLLRQDQGNLY